MTPRDDGRDPFAELADLGGPRALPESLRLRLEQSMLTSVEEMLPAGIDAARPLPVAFRHRLEHALTARAVNRWRMPVGIAAALVLLLGLASLALVPRDGRRDTNLTATAEPDRTAVEPSDAALESPPVSEGVTESGGALAGDPATGGPAAGTAEKRAVGASSARASGPPPPFAYPSSAERSSASQDAGPAAASPSGGASGGGSSSGAPPTSGPPLVVQTHGLTPVFRAYIDLVNHNGGINGRGIQLIEDSRSLRSDAAVNVNFYPSQIIQDPQNWGALLMSPEVDEKELRGDVFSFASTVEHQAHLIADEVFPSASAGTTATIYHLPTGVPFDQRVPDALESVLRGRGVAVVRVPYSGGQLTPTRADAAFLSLDTETARAWFKEAARVGIAPSRGTAGIYSLVDESLVSAMPEGTRVISPYRFPAGDEAATIRRAIGGPMTARVVHDWVTAKSLAVALWQSGATTRPQVANALRSLSGYDSGLAPPYEVRRGTNSRTPDGVLFTNSHQVLTPSGGFRRDPH